MTTTGHVLAIDQGTTNTKVLLVDSRGAIVARASRAVATSYPQPGWVEQDADTIWQSVAEAIEACLGAAGTRQVDAIGLTNQRESVVAWDRRTGAAVGPCISWQCRRTGAFCAALRGTGREGRIRTLTGLAVDPLFSASKARWLLDHTPEGHRRAAGGELCLGTVDSWVLWNLTGGTAHACDASNASRTQLMNLQTLDWDPELLEAFGVPLAALPRIRPSSGIAGHTSGAGPLPAGVPVAALIGDSHAALFAHARCRPGIVKATYGTGSSLMRLLPAPVLSHAGLSTTVAWLLGDRPWYALEGNITATGGAVEWTARLLRLPGSSAVAALAREETDTAGAYLVPAFAGLGAPHWDEEARGVLCGLTSGTTAAHVALATVRSIAYQVRDVFDAMRRDSAEPLPELLADGGASANDALMQFQADLLDIPVVRHRSTDVSALGAASLAGLGAGFWSMADLEDQPRATDRFEPAMTEQERDRLYAGWVEAVARAGSDSRRSACGAGRA